MWGVFIFIAILIVLAYAGDLGKEYLPHIFGQKVEASLKKPSNAQNKPSYVSGKWQLTQKDGQVVASLQGENQASTKTLPVLQVGCWNQKPFAYLQFQSTQPGSSIPIQISFDGEAYQNSVLAPVAESRSYFNPIPQYLAFFKQGKKLVINYPEYGEIFYDLPGLGSVYFSCLESPVTPTSPASEK